HVTSTLSLHDALPIFKTSEIHTHKTHRSQDRLYIGFGIYLIVLRNRHLELNPAHPVGIFIGGLHLYLSYVRYEIIITTQSRLYLDRKSTRLNSSHVKK